MWWTLLVEFVIAHKEALIVLLLNEVVAINPKWFSGSIGQLILNLIRGALGKTAVSIPAPAPKV